MTEKIKLRPKQLETLTKVQQEKEELNKAFASLNNTEVLVLSLILEEHGVDQSQITKIQLEGDNLLIELASMPEQTEPDK